MKRILAFLIFLIFISVQSITTFAEQEMGENQVTATGGDKVEEEMEKEILRQIAITEALISLWEELGVTTGDKLALDIYFDAPTEESAQGLLKYMARMTQYKWEGHKKEGVNTYVVQSIGNKINVDQDHILYLAEWMVKAGYENGCNFDGFGALLPDNKTEDGS